jgi:hypothetical protein
MSRQDGRIRLLDGFFAPPGGMPKDVCESDTSLYEVLHTTRMNHAADGFGPKRVDIFAHHHGWHIVVPNQGCWKGAYVVGIGSATEHRTNYFLGALLPHEYGS